MKVKSSNTLFAVFALTWVVFALVLITGCNRKVDPKKNDTPTSGEVVIAADEAYRIILEDFKFLYEIKYPRAKLNIHYVGEDQAMEMLLSDSVRLAIVSCEPGERQMAFFKNKGIKHFVNHIANDGIVLVANKECPLDSLNLSSLRALMNGQITDWSQLTKNTKGLSGQPVVGFSTQGSGIANYMRKHYLNKGASFSPQIGTFKQTKALLDTIAKYKHVIGLIGYNYISDKDDSTTRYIKQNFKVLSLQSLKNHAQFVLPSQASIADSAYPLVRRVLTINREGKSGLGTGFVIFLSSHKGQRVMLKAGMIPATMPAREVRFIERNIKL